MGYRAILMFTLTLILALNSQAFAQDKTGASVVVLKFNTAGVDKEITDLFFLELHEQIRAQQGMHVAGSGEVTIQDLMLMGGCSEPNTECLKGLSDFIEGDRVVFGSISKENETYSFNVSMFDFAQGRYLREIKDLTLTGKSRDVQAKLPVVAEALMYGNVGVLNVSIDGSGAARVFVNEVDKGRTPLALSELPLGEVTVTAWGDDESEYTETVVLRHDQPEEVVFSIDTPMVVSQGSSSSTPYLVSGIALATIGVAGLVTAAIGHMDIEQLNTKASGMMTAGNTAININKAGEVNDLQSDMNTAQTMRVVGVSVGAVGIVAGTILLVKAFTSSGSDDVASPVAKSSSPVRNLRVAPSASGIGFSLGGNF